MGMRCRGIGQAGVLGGVMALASLTGCQTCENGQCRSGLPSLSTRWALTANSDGGLAIHQRHTVARPTASSFAHSGDGPIWTTLPDAAPETRSWPHLVADAETRAGRLVDIPTDRADAVWLIDGSAPEPPRSVAPQFPAEPTHWPSLAVADAPPPAPARTDRAVGGFSGLPAPESQAGVAPGSAASEKVKDAATRLPELTAEATTASPVAADRVGNNLAADNLRGDPKKVLGRSEILSSEAALGRADDYGWVQGRLQRIHARGGAWQIRFASHEDPDRYGGKFILHGGLGSAKDGDLIRVSGRVLGDDPRRLGTQYRVEQIQIIQATGTAAVAER